MTLPSTRSHVLTRHDLHARQVLAALSAGKHVFCEKPLAIHPDELDEIEKFLSQVVQDRHETGASQGAPCPVLAVGYNRRFAPLAIQLKAFFSRRTEPFAAHYRVNAGHLPPDHWLHNPLEGGGRIIGEGCHFIDFLTFLAGEPPISVSVNALPDGGNYQEDNVVMSFTFPDGSIGMVAYLANGDKAFPKERIEVFSGGRVGVLDDYRSLSLLKDGQKHVYRSRLRQDKGHRAEWQAFASTITGKGPIPIPYEQLFSVTRATFAAVKALRSGEKVNLA
jgi:predicted dehydrogenase